jgi:type VI secretion system protein ImpJ
VASGELIHWHEGLFLEPHHLQMMQRAAGEQFSAERHMLRAHPYGLLEAEISPDELENMHVRFRKLRAVMPSGTVVDVPANAAPPALDIREAFKSGNGPLTVYLGVPLWYASRSNTVDQDDPAPWRTKSLYRLEEVESVDENTGEDPRPVLVRRINARLLLDGDDTSDLEVLPVLKIVHATEDEEGSPRADAKFIPPCFSLSGSTVLCDMVQDLANQVGANRTELVNQLGREGFSADTVRGMQIEQLMRLKTLNRFSARLTGIAAATGVSPFDVYLTLGELLGELAALQPDRDPFHFQPYDHDHPELVFPDLCERIRALLRGAVTASCLKEPFGREPELRAMIAALSDDALAMAHEYFLAVRSKEDPRAVAKLVEDPDRFKLLPRSLVNKRIRGIRLVEERHPPLEFPAEAGLSYFRLMRDQSPQIWEQITTERAIGATWLDLEASDFSLTLFMTVPEATA